MSSHLEKEFREIIFSDGTVYEIINRNFGPNISRLLDLVLHGERSCIYDKASTNILDAMQDVYRA